MINLSGKYSSAKIFTPMVEDEAINQVVSLLNNPISKGSKIRMMPDIHAGKGCTIGTTMTITDKICPNLVGVDIGCGLVVVKLNIKKKDVNFEELDKVIRDNIPLGYHAHKKVKFNEFELNNLKCYNSLLNIDRIEKSIGTLGGGNHFIELNESNGGDIYLSIHSGSRNLGQQVANHYQGIAIEQMKERNMDGYIEGLERLKAEGKYRDIEEYISNNKPSKLTNDDFDLAYLTGDDMKDYINDMVVTQNYANANRNVMADIIIDAMGWESKDSFQTIHNYIDGESNILRKGAISAKLGEKVIVPINMRDGSILAYGKGNEDWNYSAPHGAGRVMGRMKAMSLLNFDEFKQTMLDANVFTTSVNKSTLDEAPEAYKKLEDILMNVKDTLDIIEIIKPIYNLKA